MADLTSVIEGAVSEATDAGIFESSDSPDATTETTDTTTTDAAPAAEDAPAPAAEAAPDAATEPPAAPAKEPAPKTDAEELAAIKSELLEKTPDLAKGRIRVIDHQAVLTRTRRKHEAEVAALNTKLEGYKPYDAPDIREQFAAIRLAEHNPDVFFNRVLLNDPRYKALVESHVAEAVRKVAPAPAPKAPEPVAEMPKPDVLNPDGTLSYSHEAAQKAIDFQVAAARAEFQKELKTLREELTPVTERAQMERRLTEAMDKQGAVLKNARTNWRGFTEHEGAIRAELAKPGNEAIDLFQAYVNVVVHGYEAKTKLTDTERAKIAREEREKVVKELNAAPRTKAVRPGQVPAASADPNSPARPLEDVIRESLRTLKT